MGQRLSTVRRIYRGEEKPSEQTQKVSYKEDALRNRFFQFEIVDYFPCNYLKKLQLYNPVC